MVMLLEDDIKSGNIPNAKQPHGGERVNPA